jgi:flagellar hook-length control protein FliK
MELFSIKPKEINDPAASNNKGNTALSTLANLSSAFKELINKSGGQGESGGAFDALSKQFSGTERVEPSARTDENSYERDDLGQSSRDDYSDSSDSHSDRNEQHAEPSDNYDSNNNQPHSDERNEAADDNRADIGADNVTDRSASRDEHPQNSEHENTSDAGNAASAQVETQAETGSQDQQQGAKDNGGKTDLQGDVSVNSANLALDGAAELAQTGGNQTVTTENTASTAGAAASAQTGGNQTVTTENAASTAGAAASAQTGGNQTVTTENAASTAGSAAQRDGAVQGVAASTSNSGKDTLTNNGSNQANANANIQAKASAGTKVQGQGERNAVSGKAAQQAADLANKVGNGPKIAVTVNVADEAETIVSKPTATLTAASLKGTESDATGQTAQQAAGRNNRGVNPAALTHSAPQAQNGKNAGQAQQGNAQQGQIQAATSTGGDAKAAAPGPINAAPPSHAAASTATESATPTATASASDAQQSKENQAAKEAQAQRFTPQRQPVADQVSVQINKAIKAGLDRISIQLRPENLGRVDVKMDISRDGGVSVAVIADSKDTMELLQRDAKELLKALADAGLKAESGDLNFNLRGEQNQNAANGNNAGSNKDGNGDNAGANGNSNGEDTNLAAHEIGDIITETRVDVRA